MITALFESIFNIVKKTLLKLKLKFKYRVGYIKKLKSKKKLNTPNIFRV